MSRHLIDATPIGANIRSTRRYMCGVHDDLRRAFAKQMPRTIGLKAGHSPITLASCVARRATALGSISLDVQFLPDVDIQMPGVPWLAVFRCNRRAEAPLHRRVAYSMPQLMTMTVDDAVPVLRMSN